MRGESEARVRHPRSVDAEGHREDESMKQALENAQTVVSFTKKSIPSLLRNVRASEPTVAEWAADKLHRVFGQEQPADAS